MAPGTGTETAKTCGRSGIADVAADLTDFNVNQNAWVSSMILYKLGLFGVRGKTRRSSTTRPRSSAASTGRCATATELADNLAAYAAPRRSMPDLQDARGNIQSDEFTWYFGINPFGPKTQTPSYYRSAIKDLRSFNDRLQACNAVFDARADNLIQFIDRVASDIGSTSAILKDRAEHYNDGWFDTRADDRFWFAYGQLYGYYGLMSATRAILRTC